MLPSRSRKKMPKPSISTTRARRKALSIKAASSSVFMMFRPSLGTESPLLARFDRTEAGQTCYFAAPQRTDYLVHSAIQLVRDICRLGAGAACNLSRQIHFLHLSARVPCNGAAVDASH